MAKRKQANTGDPWPVSAIPKEYAVGEWAGRPHFTCRLCQFDTFGAPVMHQHLMSAHNSEHALELVVGAESETKQPASEEPAPELEGSRVVAVFEITDGDLEKLLSQGEDGNGTNNPD